MNVPNKVRIQEVTTEWNLAAIQGPLPTAPTPPLIPSSCAGCLGPDSLATPSRVSSTHAVVFVSFRVTPAFDKLDCMAVFIILGSEYIVGLD